MTPVSDRPKRCSTKDFLYGVSGGGASIGAGTGRQACLPNQAGVQEERPVEALVVTARASYSDLELVKYESGAIRILKGGTVQPVVVKEMLRSIATEVGVDLFNSKGGLKNTQQLGADLIRALNPSAGLSQDTSR